MTVQYLPEPYEFIERPLWWHTQGLQQTATGYGSKLTSRHCVRLESGRTYRVYVTCFSNSGSAWIMQRGQKLFVRDSP